MEKEFPKQLTLSPNSVQIIETQANFERSQTTNNLIASILWKAVVTDPEGLEIEINDELGVHIAKLLPGPQETKDKNIDGLLDDWTESFTETTTPLQIVGNEMSWGGQDDGHYKFAMAHSDSYVYFAVQVFDDQIISEKEAAPWTQDGIEIRLDARPQSVSAGGRGSREGEDILLFAISPNKDSSGSPWLFFQKNKLPEGTQYVCVESEEGYIAELAVPVSYFNQKQGSEWQNFRFNICIDDTDDDGFSQLWWQPSWRENENIPGSGMFIKK